MPYQGPYNPARTDFKGGIQILASVHFRYTEEGGTIDAPTVGARKVEVGEPFIRDMSTGRYVPFVAATHVAAGVVAEGFEDPVITNVDFMCDGENHVIVGELLYEATVYSRKLPDKVDAAFRSITPRIRYNSRY